MGADGAISGGYLLRPCTAPSCSLGAPPCSPGAPFKGSSEEAKGRSEGALREHRGSTMGQCKGATNGSLKWPPPSRLKLPL